MIPQAAPARGCLYATAPDGRPTTTDDRDRAAGPSPTIEPRRRGRGRRRRRRSERRRGEGASHAGRAARGGSSALASAPPPPVAVVSAATTKIAPRAPTACAGPLPSSSRLSSVCSDSAPTMTLAGRETETNSLSGPSVAAAACRRCHATNQPRPRRPGPGPRGAGRSSCCCCCAFHQSASLQAPESADCYRSATNSSHLRARRGRTTPPPPPRPSSRLTAPPQLCRARPALHRPSCCRTALAAPRRRVPPFQLCQLQPLQRRTLPRPPAPAGALHHRRRSRVQLSATQPASSAAAAAAAARPSRRHRATPRRSARISASTSDSVAAPAAPPTAPLPLTSAARTASSSLPAGRRLNRPCRLAPPRARGATHTALPRSPRAPAPPRPPRPPRPSSDAPPPPTRRYDLYALRRGGGTCEKGGWRGGAGREGEGRFSVSKCCFATVPLPLLLKKLPCGRLPRGGCHRFGGARQWRAARLVVCIL